MSQVRAGAAREASPEPMKEWNIASVNTVTRLVLRTSAARIAGDASARTSGRGGSIT